LHAIISKILSTGQKLYSIFIDYEKCYDKINLGFLWQKLLKENISTKIIKSLQAMYSVVRSAVRHNGEISEPVYIHQGVKQGDASSSFLFMMYVNDIIENIDSDLNGVFTVNELKFFLILYADDQVLFATSPLSLQLMLNDIEHYCNKWQLKINTKKTKVLIFERSSRHTHIDFFINNEKLEIVDSFKYLGVYFYKNGNWHRTQKCIAEHASKAMYRLFSVFNNYEFNITEQCKLFDILVSSVLNYSSEVWGLNEGKDIEIVHTKFLRKLLCVNKSTNLSALYGELGRVPLIIMRKIHMIRYWIKLIKLDNRNVTKRIYIMLKNDADNNFSYNNQNWAHQIKTMLQKLGLSNIWINQETCDISFNIIKQRILDHYYQTWYSEINNSRRLITYSRFKHSFELEPYLDQITEKKYRIALSRFRLSSHSLEIERGRYFNIPQNERKCQFCNMNFIENEYHFLLVCPMYKDLRKQFLKPYYLSWPNLNKFDSLMETRNAKIQLNLGKYIYKASRLRNQLET
jgi:hypothetical protein